MNHKETRLLVASEVLAQAQVGLVNDQAELNQVKPGTGQNPY